MKTYYNLLPIASDKKLIAILSLAIEEERYEDAAKIRFEIDRRAAQMRLYRFIDSINRNQILED